MKKVLIISYFFPPANFVGGDRTAAWAKYLHKFGIFPIIITRQWNEGQTDLVNDVKANDFVHEKHEHCEIYRLPYHRSLRDKLANYPQLKILQKAFTFLELILANFSINALPYSNFYVFSKKLLTQDHSIKALIASGRPFQSFFIGYKLKKAFDILWIPDYRDEWSTHQNITNKNLLQKFISSLEKASEKRWTSSCDFFITVSEQWEKSIKAFVNKPGHVVLNGWEPSNNLDLPKPDVHKNNKCLQIIYTGTLYPYQEIEMLIQSCKNIIEKNLYKIEVKFIGTNVIPEENVRLKHLVQGYEKHFKIFDRMPKSEMMNHLQDADILYLTAYTGNKGWYPVKLFEYYATKKNMLLCPSDNGVMQGFIEKTNSGFIVNSVEECENLLLSLCQKKEQNIPVTRPHDENMANFYSRENQTKKLAEILSLHI
ncbi:MAG: glycosyltransferase [Bacteroidetes bacterium]|nr:glycosyltransferase [Bacteroidota bacterium]